MIIKRTDIAALTFCLNIHFVSQTWHCRLTVAHNSTLMQEVSNLRTQVARQSTTSDTSVLQLSASKPSQKVSFKVICAASVTQGNWVITKNIKVWIITALVIKY